MKYSKGTIKQFAVWAGAVCVSLSLASAALPGMRDAGVTLRGAKNWAGYGGDENEQHYSSLDQINDKNIDKLGLAWSYDIDVVGSSMSAPVVVDGVLYFAAGYSVIHAVDARTGKLLWRYDPEAAKVAGRKLRMTWGIRGITFGDGKIYTGTIDGRLIALDAKSGKLVWSAMTVDKDDGRTISGPPTFFNGKVIIGHGGADFAPVRGYVTTYDAQTGKQLWRFYTVPGDPAQGFENDAMRMAAKTWNGEWWKFGGGGTVWNAITYDRKYNRIYIGTGNGDPWNQKIRSPGGGDNLFLCSIVALDADTGKYVWHYQMNPGETWDYTATMDIELTELNLNGEPRDVILTAPKNGFFYVIDRKTGKLISAQNYVKVTWASRIDTATGRPVENPEARYPAGREAVVYPGAQGAHSIEAMSFNPKTGLAYLNAIDMGNPYVDPEGDLSKWHFIDDAAVNMGVGAPKTRIGPSDGHNSLLAWDPVKQRAAWSVPLPGIKNGATLTTAGNLVFQGTVRGQFIAYAADTGKKLWAFDAQNGVEPQGISYEVNGKQYISVISDWRWAHAAGPGTSWDHATQKRRLLTFALGGRAKLPPNDSRPLPFVDDPAVKIDPALAGLGAGIYARKCMMCHGLGLDSAGGAPDLRKSAVPLSNEAFDAVLAQGPLVANGMPRFADLTLEERRALQAYIRSGARAAMHEGSTNPAEKPAGGTLQ